MTRLFVSISRPKKDGRTQLFSHSDLPGLNDAVDEAESPDDGEEEKPPPEDQEHLVMDNHDHCHYIIIIYLVIDHVQSQHTDGVDVLLAAPGAPPDHDH